MRPNHHQFTAFAYVVRESSFSAAAERLGVSQSAVTQQVAKLEREVGAQLLIRGRDGVEVTATGQELYALADRLKKTPKEIREGFTLEDYDHFLAHCRMVVDEARDAR